MEWDPVGTRLCTRLMCQEAHGTLAPCTLQAPPMQGTRSFKHPLSPSPLMPCRSQTLQSLILWVLSCSDPTYTMCHTAQTVI